MTGRPGLIISPAQQGPWGVVTSSSGPGDPPASTDPGIAQADALLREGMVALQKSRPSQFDRAERCFSAAVILLTDVLDEPHPRISWALDRLGLTYHLQDRLAEAERLYVRSLRVLAEGQRPTKWNDVTLLNLGMLYGTQGREEDHAAVMRRFRAGSDGSEGRG